MCIQLEIGSASLEMDPQAPAPKKFSFALKKPAAEAVPHAKDRRDQPSASGRFPSAQTTNGRTSSSPATARVLGFETSETGSEKPKAQALLSISDGHLEIEGGVAQAPPRIIPCRNPLPLSNYRVRITSGTGHEVNTTESAEAGPVEATSHTVRGGDNQPPVWGLQEVKRMKKEQRDSTELNTSESNARKPIVKTEPNGEPSRLPATHSITAQVKTESASQGRVTDEEAAASLIAEARGERTLSSVVPLLARNSVLAEIRQSYRREVERSQRGAQQAGEPDKLLLQWELALLPDAPPPSSSVYEAMPVEEFGAAMLRGMGLKSIPQASPPPKRKAYTRAGLGSEREIDRLRERLEQQRRLEDAAKKEQKTFISLKTDKLAKD